mmetsp:Transcript_69291/g.136926  ORF Transcript_69291/g.136926 Transcript_69291/m.136926 type:complete len:286 (+) Transcript_69291:67-924(+)
MVSTRLVIKNTFLHVEFVDNNEGRPRSASLTQARRQEKQSGVQDLKEVSCCNEQGKQQSVQDPSNQLTAQIDTLICCKGAGSEPSRFEDGADPTRELKAGNVFPRKATEKASFELQGLGFPTDTPKQSKYSVSSSSNEERLRAKVSNVKDLHTLEDRRHQALSPRAQFHVPGSLAAARGYSGQVYPQMLWVPSHDAGPDVETLRALRNQLHRALSSQGQHHTPDSLAAVLSCSGQVCPQTVRVPTEDSGPDVETLRALKKQLHLALSSQHLLGFCTTGFVVLRQP